MQTLKATDFYSGILPSGDVVTLFTGNERAFDDVDAQYLLAEFPERFARVSEERAPKGLSADKPQPAAPPPDASLETKTTDVPDDVEKFGANARRKRGN